MKTFDEEDTGKQELCSQRKNVATENCGLNDCA